MKYVSGNRVVDCKTIYRIQRRQIWKPLDLHLLRSRLLCPSAQAWCHKHALTGHQQLRPNHLFPCTPRAPVPPQVAAIACCSDEQLLPRPTLTGAGAPSPSPWDSCLPCSPSTTTSSTHLGHSSRCYRFPSFVPTAIGSGWRRRQDRTLASISFIFEQ